MANNVNYVTTGKPKVTGAVYRAPLGTTLPTDASTALDKAFKALGYLSDDGLTNGDAPDMDTVKAWGGDVVLYTSKGKEDTFKFKMIEAMNVEVLKAVYNEANVTGDLTTGIDVKATTDDAEEASWVFDIVLRGGILKRIVVPDAKITDMDDISYTDSDPVGYDVTLSATPDSSGVTHHEYIKGASA